MVACALAGNISGEATTPLGNILREAMRHPPRAIEELSIEAADSVVHHGTIVLTPQERLVGSYRSIVRQAERSSAERDCRLFLDRG
jgi:hypothetical protein